MRNLRPRAAKTKVCCRRSNSKDFISQMPDEILVLILSLLSIKDAVATSRLSTRWRFVWCDLMQLNFDGSETANYLASDRNVCASKRAKYVKQVNSVIKSYKYPIVKEFRIRCNLDESYNGYINKWLKFAVDKKVEILELDLMDNRHQKVGDFVEQDYIPLRLSDRNISLFKWPSSNAVVGMMVSLRKLYLKNVNVHARDLEEFLLNAPNLETLSIHASGNFSYVCFGGHENSLKHVEITHCSAMKTLCLYKLDIVSFVYKGPKTRLYLIELPKLKEIDMGQGLVGLDNYVLDRISFCAVSLQALSLDVYRPKNNFKLDSIPELPNVKKLSLTMDARYDDCLLEYAYIANACPNLETFTIELLWCSPIKRRRKVGHVATHPHKHLKLFKILGYYGRISDLELAVYIINNAVTLMKIVIDPRCQPCKGRLTAKDFSKNEEAARASAKKQLVPISPRGVELVIL